MTKTVKSEGETFERQMSAAYYVMGRYKDVLQKLGSGRRETMNITVRKIGNSEGVILPKDVLERNHLKAGDQLVLIEEGDGLKLRRLQDDPEEFENKMKIARERMKKYETAYRVLAK